MGAVLSLECERARRRASLGLDGELSELGRASLRAHVGRCAACAEFARDLEALTRELRAAPLERPQPAVAPARRRSAAGRLLQLGVAAAAVAIAAGFGSAAGSLTSRSATSAAAPLGHANSAALVHGLRNRAVAI